MGFVQPIQNLGQIPWPDQRAGQHSALIKPAPWRLQALLSPPGVETPEEALAYIQQLQQNGRTQELATLLRGNPVFREAWQTQQQSAASLSEAAWSLAGPQPDLAPEPASLPVLAPGQRAPDQLPTPSQDQAAAQVAATLGFSPEIQKAPSNLVPVPKPLRTLAAGRQVYENQALYYAQEKANLPRINIRI